MQANRDNPCPARGPHGLLPEVEPWADAPRQVSLNWPGTNALVSGFITDEAGIPLRSESIVASAGEITVALDADPAWIADEAN